jgi:hypothetical protein
MKKIIIGLLTLLTIEGFSQTTPDTVHLDTPKYRDLIQTIKKKVESYNKFDDNFIMDGLTYVTEFEKQELSHVNVIMNDKEIYTFMVDSKSYEIIEVFDWR